MNNVDLCSTQWPGVLSQGGHIHSNMRFLSSPGKPGQKDADLIEDYQGNSNDALVDRIDGRGNDSSEDKGSEHSKLSVFGKSLRGVNTDLGQELDQNRGFKAQPDGKK